MAIPSKNKDIGIKLLIWLIIALVLASSVYSLGIAPGHTDLNFEPNAEQKIKLKLINSDNQPMQVVLYADGELSKYISFEQPLLEIRADEKEKYAYYTVKLPASFEKQGTHSADIVARAIPIATSNEGVGVSASVAVVSKLNVIVPYSGKYAEITLFSPNFELDKGGNFAVEVRNLGTEDILQGQLVIEVLGPVNDRIALLKSESFNLASKQNQIVTVNWIPSVGLGSYKAVASLIYEGANAKDERVFNIGELAIKILDISVKDFKLGGIAMFDIMLENTWNDKIPGVYGDITVKDEAGKTYTKFKTASVDMSSNEKQKIQAYWDTNNVGPGNYKLNIILNYIGKKSEQVFDILVSVDQIRTTAVGQVVSMPESKGGLLTWVYVLIFFVILLIIFNVLVFFKKIRIGKDKTQ